MTNEAVIVETPMESRRYQITDANAITKGALLQLLDPNTASGAVVGAQFAGIASADKVASDGSTNIGAYTKGIFDLYCSEAVNAGQLVSLSGGNMVKLAVANDVISGSVVGKALETATANETIRVAVGSII